MQIFLIMPNTSHNLGSVKTYRYIDIDPITKSVQCLLLIINSENIYEFHKLNNMTDLTLIQVKKLNRVKN